MLTTLHRLLNILRRPGKGTARPVAASTPADPHATLHGLECAHPSMIQPGEPWPRRRGAAVSPPIPEWRRRTVTMTAAELQAAVDFVAPDLKEDAEQGETLVTLAVAPAGGIVDDEGNPEPTGPVAWLTDYPEEGALPLTDMTEARPPTVPACECRLGECENKPGHACRMSVEIAAAAAQKDDPAELWAEIHRLRAAAAGPTGFSSWKDAAVAERRRRVELERELQVFKDQNAELMNIDARSPHVLRLEGELAAALASVHALVQPETLEEPVNIAKAMRAHRRAEVWLNNGTGPACCVGLVNIQLVGWNRYDPREACAFANGFNDGARLMRNALAPTTAPASTAAP